MLPLVNVHGRGFGTTLIVIFEGYSLEWCTELCATTNFVSS